MTLDNESLFPPYRDDIMSVGALPVPPFQCVRAKAPADLCRHSVLNVRKVPYASTVEQYKVCPMGSE